MRVDVFVQNLDENLNFIVVDIDYFSGSIVIRMRGVVSNERGRRGRPALLVQVT